MPRCLPGRLLLQTRCQCRRQVHRNETGFQEHPVLNVSADPGQEYFSDGITKDLITDISKVRGLDVTARNSLFVYKGSRKDEQIIGREFDVGFVLAGTIQKAENHVRINVQLIMYPMAGTFGRNVMTDSRGISS